MKRLYNILRNNALVISFGVSIVSLAVAAVFLLRGGHIFYGDFSLYIRQAQSLLDGTQDKVFRDMTEMLSLSTYKYYSPTLYPWGLPLLEALPVAVFDINYTVLKIMLYACLAFTFFIIFRSSKTKEEDGISAWVLLLLGFNIDLIVATDWVITTLPFGLILMLSLAIVRRYHPADVNGVPRQILWGIGIGAVLFLTAEMRTEGFLLLAALFGQCTMSNAQYTTKQIRKRLADLVMSAAVPCLTFFGLFYLLSTVFPAGFAEHTSHFKDVSRYLITDNLYFYATEGAVFCLRFLGGWGEWVIWLFWGIVLMGMAVSLRKRVADAIFLLTCIGLYSVWPYQNVRYFVPLSPIVLYFFVRGWFFLLKLLKMKRLHFSVITMFACVAGLLALNVPRLVHHNKGYDNYKLNVESPSSKAMLAYLNVHTKATDVIGCCENRTIYLYTGRISCNLFYSLDDTVQKADWYVCFRNRGNFLQHEPYELEEDAVRFRKVFENGDFTIYRCLPKSSQRDFQSRKEVAGEDENV